MPRRAIAWALAAGLWLAGSPFHAAAQEPSPPAPEATPELAATPTPAPTPAPTPIPTPDPILLLPSTVPTPAPLDTITSESLSLRITQLGDRIAVAEANATPETAARLNIPQQRLRDRVERLREWQSRLQRIQTALERQAAARAALDAVSAEAERFRETGLTASPPYALQTLFTLLDERDNLRREQETTRIALEAARADVADAQRQREAAERDWRALNEQFRTAADDPARRTALGRDLEDATISVERALAQLTARELDLRIATLQQDRIARALELLAEEAALVVNALHFPRQDLNDRLADLAERRDNVRTLAENARRAVETNLRILSDAQVARDRAVAAPADASLARLRVEVAERRLEISQTNVSLFEDQLDRIDREERLWNRLHAVLAGIEITAWRDWRRETEDLLRALERDRTVRAANQGNLRTRLLERERETIDFQGPSEELELRRERVRLLNNQDAYFTRDLSDLDALLRLANRFLDVLSIQDAKLTWRERFDRIKLAAARLWGLELFSAGDSPVTVAKLVVALLVMVTGIWFSKHIARVVARLLRARFHVNQGAAVAFERLATYTAVLVLFLIAFRLVNIPLTAFAFLGGAAALGFGFGSQNILNNFISGLILLAERPIAVGDLVEVDGILGTVEQIGGRSTSIRAVGGNIHYVPNSQLLEKRVVNWLRNPQLRLSVTVGVVHGSPTRTVHKLLVDILDRHGSVLRDPEPIVIFGEYGENSLQFELIFWIRIGPQGSDGRVVRSDLRHMIARAFEEAGIEIAFPQRDIHLHAKRPLEVRVAEARPPHAPAQRVGPEWAPTILGLEQQDGPLASPPPAPPPPAAPRTAPPSGGALPTDAAGGPAATAASASRLAIPPFASPALSGAGAGMTASEAPTPLPDASRLDAAASPPRPSAARPAAARPSSQVDMAARDLADDEPEPEDASQSEGSRSPYGN